MEGVIARNRQSQWIWTRRLKGGMPFMILSVTRKIDRMYYYCETRGDIIMV